MTGKRPSKARYICPRCMEVYEFYIDELNDSVPVCLRCGVALVMLRRRGRSGSGK